MAKSEKPVFVVRGRVWVETNQGAFLGAGRVDLLLKIEEQGSISKAAKAMKMSYRQAWELIDSMNRKSKEPLVISQSGGKGGGGAEVTKAGKKAIKEFLDLNQAFKEFMEQRSKKFKF